MKRVFSLFLALTMITLFSCTSDNEPSVKNSETVEVSDIQGEWVISSPDILNNSNLVLKNYHSLLWTNRRGESYAGPYYAFTNVNDGTLKAQGSLLGVDNLDWIRIQDIRFPLRSVGGNKHLIITCALNHVLPDIDWCEKVDKWTTVNRDSWYFWSDSWFSYRFEVIEYNERQMKLKLLGSSVSSHTHENDYPLRMENGVVINLQRLNM